MDMGPARSMTMSSMHSYIVWLASGKGRQWDLLRTQPSHIWLWFLDEMVSPFTISFCASLCMASICRWPMCLCHRCRLSLEMAVNATSFAFWLMYYRVPVPFPVGPPHLMTLLTLHCCCRMSLLHIEACPGWLDLSQGAKHAGHHVGWLSEPCWAI
jgi:hypothetical protein